MLRGGRASGRRGTAALEFGLIAPVMISMFIGVFDITRGMIVQQQVYNAAHMIPVSASTLAVQPDSTTSLTVSQVQQSLSAVFAAIPGRRSGSLPGQASATMTSVTFVQVDASCTSACAVAPHVAWSVAYADPPGRIAGNANSFQTVTRPCMQLNQTGPAADAPGDLTSLPTANVASPDPLLVVDVHYRFTPLFLNFVTGPIDFWASGYWAVRSVDPNAAASAQYTKYDTANQAGGAGKCSGYS